MEIHRGANNKVKRKKEIQESRTVSVSVGDTSRRLTICVKSFEKDDNRVHQVYQFHQNGLTSLYGRP